MNVTASFVPLFFSYIYLLILIFQYHPKQNTHNLSLFFGVSFSANCIQVLILFLHLSISIPSFFLSFYFSIQLSCFLQDRNMGVCLSAQIKAESPFNTGIYLPLQRPVFHSFIFRPLCFHLHYFQFWLFSLSFRFVQVQSFPFPPTIVKKQKFIL